MNHLLSLDFSNLLTKSDIIIDDEKGKVFAAKHSMSMNYFLIIQVVLPFQWQRRYNFSHLEMFIYIVLTFAIINTTVEPSYSAHSALFV